MTAAALERRLRDAVSDALARLAPGLARAPVARGAWEDASEGRGADAGLRPVGVEARVSVSPPSFGRAGLNRAEFACELRLRFAAMSAAEARATVHACCGAAERLLLAWVWDPDGLAEDLCFPGCRPFALTADGGDAPARGADGSVSVSYRFTVRAAVTADAP